MSDASDRLARTRQAILEQIEHRENGPQRGKTERPHEGEGSGVEPKYERKRAGSGWFARFRYAASTWWRHHPAHMGLELATPALSAYASRKPLQYLGIAAAVGAVVVLARPWRLMSITGVLVAIAKSSQLSNVVLSALSAADYPRDEANE